MATISGSRARARRLRSHAQRSMGVAGWRFAMRVSSFVRSACSKPSSEFVDLDPRVRVTLLNASPVGSLEPGGSSATGRDVRLRHTRAYSTSQA